MYMDTPNNKAGAIQQPKPAAVCGCGRVKVPAGPLADAKGHYLARAAVLKALAHPTRLFIVDRLAQREHCVCELTELVGADISTVSRHLGVLREAGIVSDDKRGKEVWYRLRVPCILDFFACADSVLAERLARLGKERDGDDY